MIDYLVLMNDAGLFSRGPAVTGKTEPSLFNHCVNFVFARNADKIHPGWREEGYHLTRIHTKVGVADQTAGVVYWAPRMINGYWGSKNRRYWRGHPPDAVRCAWLLESQEAAANAAGQIPWLDGSEIVPITHVAEVLEHD